MQTQFNYANFPQSDALEAHVEEQLAHHVGRFADRLTRVEVHLSDENSTAKRGPDDMRCMLEARPAGLKPISVDDRDGDIYAAVRGAAKKLQRALERRLEKKAAR